MLFVLGGLCWAVAQVLEQLQFGPGHVAVDGYWFYVFIEETLENVGSATLLLAGVATITGLGGPVPRHDVGSVHGSH